MYKREQSRLGPARFCFHSTILAVAPVASGFRRLLYYTQVVIAGPLYSPRIYPSSRSIVGHIHPSVCSTHSRRRRGEEKDVIYLFSLLSLLLFPPPCT